MPEPAGRERADAAGIALIVLALLLPLALLGGIGALASRGLGHRRRERALDMA